MPIDPRLDPRLDSMAAIIEAITGQPYGSGGGPRPEEEIRVVLPMDAWDEHEYLAADDTEEPTDLATVLSLARDGADVLCEGEEEGDEWAFYVAGFTLEELLPLVQEAIPEGWNADSVPVHADAVAVSQIAITPATDPEQQTEPPCPPAGETRRPLRHAGTRLATPAAHR